MNPWMLNTQEHTDAIIHRLKQTAEDLAFFYENDDNRWIEIYPYRDGFIQQGGTTRVVKQWCVPAPQSITIADICCQLCQYLPIEEVWEWSKNFDVYVANYREANGRFSETIVMVDGSIKVHSGTESYDNYQFTNPTVSMQKVRLSNRIGKPVNTMDDEEV